MIIFNSLWVLLLAPLPLLVLWLAPSVKQNKKAALIAPFYTDLIGHSNSPKQSKTYWLPLTIAALAWLSLVISAADPRWYGEPVPLPTKGRNLMMAVDLSGSMEERDFNFQGQYIDRLTATKLVAGEFIEKRQGDRLGLILFADEAYTQTPLTFDTSTVKQLLDEAVLGLAGQKTAIGDAIALAVKKMDESDEQQKILILLTDGENTAGDIDPIKAAQLAADQHLKIYTIGIGSANNPSLFGARSQLDEQSLKQIAQLTGGQYFKANNLQELSKIYNLLDQLEPVSQDEDFFRPNISLYFWPLLAGVSLLVILAFYTLVTSKITRR